MRAESGVEMAVNEKIEMSEECDRLMKRSIAYLKIGFWTIVVWTVLLLISILGYFSMGISVLSGILGVICIGAIFGLFLLKMYAYIRHYKIFRNTKTQQALEDLLDAQKGYYCFIYLVLPLSIILVYLVVFFLGTSTYIAR